MNKAEVKRYKNDFKRRKRKVENYFFPKIVRLFKKQYKAVIESLNTNGYNYTIANIDKYVKWGDTAAVIKEIYSKSAYIESNHVLKDLKRRKRRKRLSPTGFSLGFDEISSVVEQYFKIRLLNDSAIPITQFTKLQITRELVRQVDDLGKTYDDAIKDFSALAISWTGREGKAYKRAGRIAITETTRAMSFGSLIGAYMSGVDCEKIWVTSDDERVRGGVLYPNARFPHTQLDLNRSELRGAFYNRELIKFPGDPDASAANTVMCRCALYYEEKPRPAPIAIRSLSKFMIDIFGVLLAAIVHEFTEEQTEQ